MKKVLIIILCVWGGIATASPLRNSPDELRHLDEVESHSREEPTTTLNEERIRGTTEMSVEDNVRRMQGNRNRAKQSRRAMIKHQIETMLNIKGKDMPSVEEEFGSAEVSYNNSGLENIDQVIKNMNNVVIKNDPVEEIHHHGSRYSDYTEKLQSLYPKCNYSNHGPNTNEVLADIMNKGHVMHIRFEINHLKASPQVEEQYVTEVLSGRLRLFQKELLAPEVIPTSQSLIHPNDFNQPNVVKTNVLDQGIDFDFDYNNNDTNDSLHEENIPQLRAIVSWVKDNTTVVVDTQTIPRYTPVGGRWVTFNILKAVKSWNTTPNENYGIIIEIEHQSSSLSADSVFRQMNCSDSAKHPFPSVLENLSREIIDDLQIQEESSSIVSESLNTNMYPMLDICTVEIPKSEVFRGAPSNLPLIPILNFGKISQFNQTGQILVNTSKNQYVLNRIQNLQNENQLENIDSDMEFKIPSDLADIGNHHKSSINSWSKSSGSSMSNRKQKSKMKGFHTLPKLENISYGPNSRSNNNELQAPHDRRHTKTAHHKKSRSKPHQARHKRRNKGRNNRRHNPRLLRDIANDQPISNSGTNEEFTPYAPIIEQVKLTNQELKEVLKLQILHQKNIDQELKLLEQFSKASNYRPETND